jgi:hypothetical protein
MHMSEPGKAQEDVQTESDKGPTEKLHESAAAKIDQGIPGAQNPDSEEIKDEQQPNTE